MATTLNSLGPFLFRNWLTPPPGRIRETTEVIESPGVNYQAVRLRGLRSQPFTMEGVIDCATGIQARSYYIAYSQAVGTDPMPLVWANYNFDIEGQRAVILDCDLISIQRKVAICGAVVPGNTIDMRVRFQLLLTPYNP